MSDEVLLRSDAALAVFETGLALLRQESREGAAARVNLVTRNQSLADLQAIAPLLTADEFVIEGALSSTSGWAARMDELCGLAEHGVTARLAYPDGTVRLALSFTVDRRWLLNSRLFATGEERDSGGATGFAPAFRDTLRELGCGDPEARRGRLDDGTTWQMMPRASAALESPGEVRETVAKGATLLATRLAEPDRVEFQVTGRLSLIEELATSEAIEPAEVPEFLDWLLGFSKRRGLELFDPQIEPVTAEDQAEFERRLATLRAAECEERARKDLPVVAERAATGDARALVKLGTHYSFGEGVERDLDQAFKCYRRAAELGHPDGMFNLAACYRLGEGTEVNVEKAIHWYTRASDLGEVFAPFELGNLFAGSDGVETDLERAALYFKLARERGHQDASRRLREIGAEPPLAM